MMSTLSLRCIRFDRSAPMAFNVRNTFDIFPHLINDYRTNQRVLDGAWEQKWRRILYQIAHDRRFTAVARIDVTVPFRQHVLHIASIRRLPERLDHMIWFMGEEADTLNFAK